MREPSEDDAAAIAAQLTQRRIVNVRRFATGIAHWVYEAETDDGGLVVVKIGNANQEAELDGAATWSSVLRSLGIPVPDVLSSGTLHGFPFIAMPRLPGEDLGTVYPTLTAQQKTQLAHDICDLQRRVHSLPHAAAFGFAHSLGAASRPTWKHVLLDNIQRSQARIRNAGLLPISVVDPLLERLPRLDSYLDKVEPVAFLDDTTTKNVLVDAGELSGIVDVDWICYGDPLFVVALTRVALLSRGYDTVYTDAWTELLQPSATQRSALGYYCALFCADFLGELGQPFNGNNPQPDVGAVSHLTSLLSQHLQSM